ALETGIATGPDLALAWDSIAAPRQAWWPQSWAGGPRVADDAPRVRHLVLPGARAADEAGTDAGVPRAVRLRQPRHLRRDRHVLAHRRAPDLGRRSGRIPAPVLFRRSRRVRRVDPNRQGAPGARGDAVVPPQREDGMGGARRGGRAADRMVRRGPGTRR